MQAGVLLHSLVYVHGQARRVVHHLVRCHLPELLRFSTCHDVQSAFFIAADAALLCKVWMTYWQTDYQISETYKQQQHWHVA